LISGIFFCHEKTCFGYRPSLFSMPRLLKKQINKYPATLIYAIPKEKTKW